MESLDGHDLLEIRNRLGLLDGSDFLGDFRNPVDGKPYLDGSNRVKVVDGVDVYRSVNNVIFLSLLSFALSYNCAARKAYVFLRCHRAFIVVLTLFSFFRFRVLSFAFNAFLET